MSGSFEPERWNACEQTRPRFILSSERVLGGMESEPMSTPREKSPLTENNSPQISTEPTTLHQARQRGQRPTNELFRPHNKVLVFTSPSPLLLRPQTNVTNVKDIDDVVKDKDDAVVTQPARPDPRSSPSQTVTH